MRHVTRTHRINLDWLFERLQVDPGIIMKYVNTKRQVADILTKGNFTADQWNQLLNLSQITTLSKHRLPHNPTSTLIYAPLQLDEQVSLIGSPKWDIID